MANEEKEKKNDIWLEGVKSIMASTKRSLLDYIDAIAKQGISQPEKERLEKIKGRVHNDISQAAFSVGILIATFKSGGDISAFENDLTKKSTKQFNSLFQKKDDIIKDNK